MPRLGSVNLHASLLPDYRGASPIQAALLDGRAETGNTTLWIDEGLDTGDMILARALAIGPDETAGELSTRLAADGARLLVETVERIARGDAPRKRQDRARGSLTRKIRKEAGRLDFTRPAGEVHDRARAMTPWPGAVVAFAGQPVIFERTRLASFGAVPSAGAGSTGTRADVSSERARPGAVLGTGAGGGLVVACGVGAIEVLRIRPAGKGSMEAAAWWRGLRLPPGAEDRFTTYEGEAS